MPTITIRTVPCSPSRRRAVAVRLTRWLTDHGVPPAHVVVRFEEQPEQTTFTGGLPLEALPHRPGVLRHAAVTCCVGPDRDERFRAGLAAEIADALGAGPDTPFFYLEFRPTSPADVYLAKRGVLRRADGPEHAPAEPTGRKTT
ncbi:hypothetical protein ACN27G_16575 [Plantactinospora sp. WMMB334]|uniref:hypothetical protein n=1 Tax=Plantactinospora sp. WMMB334 TaxID=3404119 RepID=UPI003B952FC5